MLRCDVAGRVVMKAFLSGMPDVKLGLNDKLEDVTFHPCVNLGRFNAEGVVSFVPPDGEFELMKYRCTEGIALPFKAVAMLTEKGRTRLEVAVKVKSAFPAKLWAGNVVITVPVPEQTARATFDVTAGARARVSRGSLGRRGGRAGCAGYLAGPVAWLGWLYCSAACSVGSARGRRGCFPSQPTTVPLPSPPSSPPRPQARPSTTPRRTPSSGS